MLQTPEGLVETLALDVRTGHEVLHIDPKAKRVEVRELDAGRTTRELLDRDPASGAVFLFTGKRGSSMKVLWWVQPQRQPLEQQRRRARLKVRSGWRQHRSKQFAATHRQIQSCRLA